MQSTKPISRQLNTTCCSTVDKISLVAWNCHGLSNAVPYLQILANSFDIILVSEHWLWPYELHTLDTILPGYKGFGCSDKRLTESSSLNRGCGGIALLWKDTLPVTPVAGIHSGRIAAVQLPISSNMSLYIVGVYPGADPGFLRGGV